MERTLAVGFFKEEDIRRGFISWSGKYYNDIKSISGINDAFNQKPLRAVGYLNGFKNKDEQCFNLSILKAGIYEKFIEIKYIVNGNTKFTSGFMQKSLKNLFQTDACKQFIPLCMPVESEKLERAINEEIIIYKVKELLKKNDWKGVINIFGSIENVLDNNSYRNNDELLNCISFAAAKLSESYVNIKRSFCNDEEKNKFLKQQKNFRDYTIKLRKRCIELKPENASYYSNLGYSYYQFARELQFIGGRRDGSVREEVNKSIGYIDTSLKLDPQRIPDLYRKGQMLTRIMPQLISYGEKKIESGSRIVEYRKIINEGIECFKRVEQIWDILPVIEDKRIKRYQKEYVKSLYHLSLSYQKLTVNDWDITKYMMEQFEPDVKETQMSIYEKMKVENLDKAIAYIEKCSAADNSETQNNEPDAVISNAKNNGYVEGEYKLYIAGKCYFKKYIILSQSSSESKQESEYYRDKAEEFYNAAMKNSPSRENRNQSKGYIVEKLARLLITKGEYEKAAEVLKKYAIGNTDFYIKSTYLAASILSGNYAGIDREINYLISRKKDNTEAALMYFLEYVKCMKQGRRDDAAERLNRAVEYYEKSGRRNIDKLIINQAHISYKSGRKEEAIKFLKKAYEINPQRKELEQKIRNLEGIKE